MLKVPFSALDITASDFTGMNALRASQAVINLTADAVNKRFPHPETAIETMYDWPNALVNWSGAQVEVPLVPFNEWYDINS